MKPIHVHPDAEAEADGAFEWYWERSEPSALRFDVELRAAYASLRKTPGIYPFYIRGTRKVVLHSFPFLVVFRDLPRKIQIIAVAHAKRKPGYWTSRL